MVSTANPTKIHPRISSFWSGVRRSHKEGEGFLRREDALDDGRLRWVVVVRDCAEDEPALLLDERLVLLEVLRFVMSFLLYTLRQPS
jgi:hypothetical protein